MHDSVSLCYRTYRIYSFPQGKCVVVLVRAPRCAACMGFLHVSTVIVYTTLRCASSKTLRHYIPPGNEFCTRRTRAAATLFRNPCYAMPCSCSWRRPHTDWIRYRWAEFSRAEICRLASLHSVTHAWHQRHNGTEQTSTKQIELDNYS